MKRHDKARFAAGVRAFDEYVREDMCLGLGSGTTACFFVRELGERIRGGFRMGRCVATSLATEKVAREAGVPLLALDRMDELAELDLTLDGADEIDGQLRMIKGGGACLLREKIVARASKRMIALVDETKLVDTLGAFPLPVEVVPFAWRQIRVKIAATLLQHEIKDATIRLRGGCASPVTTDNGHYILDCACRHIEAPDRLAPALDAISGLVEHGLFIDEASSMVVGRFDGSSCLAHRPGR